MVQLGATDDMNAFWNGWEQVRMMLPHRVITR